MPNIRILDTSNIAELKRCFPVYKVLRPHLDEQEFIRRVQIQVSERFQIAFIEEDEKIVAAAGYRIQHNLFAGRMLYLDDLITDPLRKKSGHATALLEWVKAYAIAEQCDAFHLDSGYQRHDAHRLYLKNGFDLASHHFAKTLP